LAPDAFDAEATLPVMASRSNCPMRSHHSLPGEKNGRLSGEERSEGVRGVVNDPTVESSWQGVVTLAGRVSAETIKGAAERIARGTRGVKDVHNEFLVGRMGTRLSGNGGL
jgi:hypothetical protein